MPRKRKTQVDAKQPALNLPQTTANTSLPQEEQPKRKVNITIKAKYFSLEQSKELDAILRSTFPRSVITYTTGYPNYQPTSFYLVGILTNEDKVNSWRNNLEKKYKVILPTETITITEYKQYPKKGA